MKNLLLALGVIGLGLLYPDKSAMAQSWQPTSTPATNWSSIASSANGDRLAATVYGGGIYTSTNSGTTWPPTLAPDYSWESVASSADGLKLVAAALSGQIYTST